ncbi:MAG: hypothetical protein ACPG77_06995 [Nannocystaceae bacterium]
MIPPPEKRLSSWISKMASDLTPDGSINKVELWHSVEGEGGERLLTIRTEDRPHDEDVDDLAVEIWNEAYQDASTRTQGRPQRYIVQMFRGSDITPEDSRGFVIVGMGVSSLTGGSSEPPTARGVLGQDMRQNDNLHALVVRMCEASAGTLAVQLERERRENDRLREANRKAAALEQDLLDRKHDRDLKREQESKKEDRLDSLLTLASSMVPMIAAKVLGAGQPSPDGSPPALEAAKGAARDQSVGSLLSSLEASQVQQIFSVLTTEQSIAMMEIYESFRSEAAPACPNNTPTEVPPGGPEEHHGQN